MTRSSNHSNDGGSFFAKLINEYLHSRPNATRPDPKRVAKRLGVRQRDFEEFLVAWRTVFGAGATRGDHAAAESDHQSDAPRKEESLVQKKPKPGTLSGFIKRIGMRGGVFVTAPDAASRGASALSAEVLISTTDLHDAQVGDEVIAQLTSRRAGQGQVCGRVIEVVNRATNSFVGTYLEQDEQGFVEVDGRNFTAPIWVGDPGAKGAATGDKVVIEMLRFPTHSRPGEAVLTRVLGAKGEPGVDLLTIIHEYGLPDEFPADVLLEASQQAERFDETDLRGRRDLTHETIVTIDPIDARDFDDAISLTKNEAEHWVLGVHIADVAHFLRHGSALDREAQRRGTSVYLPTRVLPMLPEVISNGLASLQQGRVRYTNSVFIEFTPEGVPVHTEFAKSAIKVTRRFAYDEVMPLVGRASGVPSDQDDLTNPSRGKLAACPTKVRQLLRDMHELAMTLRRRRFAKGALDLNLPEVKLDFDRQGRVSGAHEVEHDESHQMIEEFMLAANIAVATKLNDLEVGFLRRVHAEPDSKKLQAFAKFVTSLGFDVHGSQPHRAHEKSKAKNRKSKPSPYDAPVMLSKAALQDLLKKVRETPAERAVNYALLRSMRQAEYSGVPIGHYALAVREYCHFTSPIRRYPDLTIHRLFDELAAGRTPHGMSDAELLILGQQCSLTERRAAEAERELTKLKLLAWMAQRLGEEMDAVITGVERFGLFCKGTALPVDGFIHISTLSELDYFDFDADSVSLVGRKTGRRIRLGDLVRVQIAFVDVDRRELDFRLGPERPERRPHKVQQAVVNDKPTRRRGDRDKDQSWRRKTKRRRT